MIIIVIVALVASCILLGIVIDDCIYDRTDLSLAICEAALAIVGIAVCMYIMFDTIFG